MEREQLVITDAWKVIDAKRACFDGSRFVATGAERMYWEDVSLAGTKITNANLSRLEIDGVQMGGATIRHVGIPKAGDLHYNPDTAALPVTFEHCELTGCRMTNCDLRGAELVDCELAEMTIDGIPVEELLRAYRESKR